MKRGAYLHDILEAEALVNGAATDQINEKYAPLTISPSAYLYPVEDNASDFEQPKIHDEGSSSSDEDEGYDESINLTTAS
jgi:hypothetical protein